MFSILFPGQGSQNLGMANDLYKDFNYVQEYFDKTDELLNRNLSKIIFEGPKQELDQTKNTQPAIFLVSYSIFKVIEKETMFKIKKANYFAGHSLGEYSALCCADSITFDQAINLLKHRGEAMQNAVPNEKGGMIAILGENIKKINELINENSKNFKCYIANDNTNGQIVVSGKLDELDLFEQVLKKNNIKLAKLPVSAPFHSPLMSKATEEMKQIINDTEFKDPFVKIISNVTANPLSDANEIKRFLIQQIEKPVRWRESINNMINFGIKNFIEIGPGKVLSGLVKRIDRNVELNQVNNFLDAKKLLND
jgi:[acyl-carrier-protein] S-malonyltransferase|tara:strand:- start:63 stop:992 length:930 start_codon:yes stop_codon:yes gene_type:complete